MDHLNIPQGHQAVMPYLMLDGAAQFIDFCTKVFQAEVTSRHMRDERLVMHAELSIAGSTIMIADTTDDWKKQTANLFVYVKDADESYSLALAHGAVSLMGLSDQEYGRTCGVTDPSGNVWWITSVKQK